MKKTLGLIIRSDSDRLKKWWLMSKLTFLLVFIGIFNLQAALFSQSKVTLSMKGATLKDVLWAIEQQTGLVFMYSSEDLNKVGKQDVELKAKSVNDALLNCLKGTGLTFELQDNVIVLKPVTPQAKETKRVTGMVKDNTGGQLPGVTVLIKGTSVGVATDIDGNYSIALDGIANPVLVFSSVGMQTQEIAVGDKNVINVTLKEDSKDLGEVVIVGYQAVHKRNVTASVSSVKGDDLADIPVASISEMLSGKVTGLQSLSSGGGPGSRTALVIRGNTVMSGNLTGTGEANELSNPLYVIDGIPTTLEDLAGFDKTNTDFLASLNPDDIESIDILKDASAAAIYGSRGANGVIVIKTKKGKVGKLSVSVKASFGINIKPELRTTLAGGAERRAKMGLLNTWAYSSLRDEMSSAMVLTDSLNPAFNNNADYQGMFYQTGKVQDYNISLTGGTDELNYRLGVGYYGEKGIVKATGFDRYSMNLNVSQKLWEVLRNETVIRMSYTDRKTGMGDGNGHKTFPVTPQDMNSSLFYLTDAQKDFLVGGLEDLYNTNRNLEAQLSNYANIDIYKGITLNSQIGLTYWHNKRNYFQPSTIRTQENGYADYYWAYKKSASIETYLSYTKDIAKNHNINVLLGHSFDYNQYEDMSVTAEGGSGDMIKVVTGYKKSDINGSTDISMNAMLSYWARFGYRFMDRYLFDFNFRRDASSRFGKNNRWGNFPAASVAWIFSDEPFMESTGKWMNFGKVKFSIGKNGKQFSDNFLRYNVYNVGFDGVGGWQGSLDRTTYNGVMSAVPNFGQLADNNLSWEESVQWDLGLESEFFDRRLYITIDGYNRKTEALLFDVQFPSYTGFDNVKSNVAGMMNYGYEIAVNGYIFPRASSHQIEVQAGVSRNYNLVTKLPNGNRDYFNKSQNYGYVVGKPGPIFYGLEYVGVLDKVSDLPVNPYNGKPLDPTKRGVWGKIGPGYPLYNDVSGNFVVSDDGDEDLTFAEKDPNPKVMGHLNLAFTYKKWKLRVNSQFVFGRDIYDQVSAGILGRYDSGEGWIAKSMLNASDYDFWTSQGCGAKYPSLVVSSPGGDGNKPRYAFRTSSLWWEDGSYWKINDLTLSYNFNSPWMKNIGLDRLYLYGTVYNVCQWQRSKTVVDASMVDSKGYTYGDGYPTARKFVFGLNVQF